MSTQTNPAGHRARLRQRFLSDPQALSEMHLLELLLTYAIPRQDVAPLARILINHFGGLAEVLAAPYDQLLTVAGVGQQTAVLIKVVTQLNSCAQEQAELKPDPRLQAPLFELDDEEPKVLNTEMDIEPASKANENNRLEAATDQGVRPIKPAMRTFANDEIANSLTFIPQAIQFASLEAFKTHLSERLPYNSASTRQRRANYIVDRFFPEGHLDVPLTDFAARHTTERDLKPVLFYHILKAEPLAAKVAEELIWPALPGGYVERETMREFILRHLPDIGASSQINVLRSVFTTYDLLSVGTKDGDMLRFQVHAGTLEAFLYLLTAEFPEPGIYTFEALDESPLRRWLLWDREWMRRQLYNLRDFGLISKVSEIDTVRQFTLQFDQQTALKHYFEHPERHKLALREQ